MRLVRFNEDGRERPGILEQSGIVRDISAVTPDIGSEFLSSPEFRRLHSLDLSAFPRAQTSAKLSAPISRPSKIVCIGLNYADHAAESGLPIPDYPTIFLKATTAVCGPYDDLILPRNSSAVDWEAELAVVINRDGSYIDRADSMQHVGGFCIGIDFSERNFSQEGGGQWTKGKSADRFCPLGPWLVTLDEVPDPQGLELWLEVNGHTYQSSNTAEMIMGIADLISYASQFMRLLSGDVILTGTPAGVGLGQQPPVFLCEGDIVRTGIAGLGEQNHHVVPWRSAYEEQHKERQIVA